ncbi:hypothetical protein BXY51_007097 [Actinoplanes cyaneus]|nr:hypothetical protein [Actinoplanes cyaneus]
MSTVACGGAVEIGPGGPWTAPHRGPISDPDYAVVQTVPLSVKVSGNTFGPL